MIEINLLPEELRKKDTLKLMLPDLPIGKILWIVFGVFFICQIGLSIFAFYEKARISAVQAEINRLSRETEKTVRYKADILAIRGRLKEISGLTDRKFFWTRLMNSISDSTTKGVWLSALSVSEEQQDAGGGPSKKTTHFLQLTGSAVGQGEETAYIGKFIKQLKDDPLLGDLFTEIKLSNINQRKIRDYDVYDFVLVCVFKSEKWA